MLENSPLVDLQWFCGETISEESVMERCERVCLAFGVQVPMWPCVDALYVYDIYHLEFATLQCLKHVNKNMDG
jgi:hypothetical protein